MKVVAIISEYNPFHRGHAYLINRIRREMGEDCSVIAIMSGNYTQRGEAAILPKEERAQCAVAGGADLVLELPFPHSASSAERFAQAGVHIAHSLGCVDILAFGSECGDTNALRQVAENMESAAYQDAYIALRDRQDVGSAEKSMLAYEYAFNREPLLASPNNILGIEYIRALLRTNSNVRPITFPRVTAAHGDATAAAAEASATAVRRLLYERKWNEACAPLPAATADVLQKAIKNGRAPVIQDRLLSYSMLYYRLAPTEQWKKVDSLSDGLGDRLHNVAWEQTAPAPFFDAVRTKRYTDAYLRRAMLYGIFGITRPQLNTPPAYTQVLGMTERGKKVLSITRRSTKIPILTKPADYKHMPEDAKVAFLCNLRADSLYCSLLPQAAAPCDLLRYTPYCKD